MIIDPLLLVLVLLLGIMLGLPIKVACVLLVTISIADVLIYKYRRYLMIQHWQDEQRNS